MNIFRLFSTLRATVIFAQAMLIWDAGVITLDVLTGASRLALYIIIGLTVWQGVMVVKLRRLRRRAAS